MTPRTRSTTLVALLGISTLSCALAVRPTIKLEDRPPLDRDAVPLPYTGAVVESFEDRSGRPCAPASGRVWDGLIGWQTLGDDPICRHNTFDSGIRKSILELRWSLAIPANGDYELQSRRQAAGAWGLLEARGDWYTEVSALAYLELEARSPSCRAVSRQPLGKAVVTGPWIRRAGFDGWLTLPDLVLRRCSAGEQLEVRVRLVGEVNRGRIDVDAFGIAGLARADVGHAFALRPRTASDKDDPTAPDDPDAGSRQEPTGDPVPR